MIEGVLLVEKSPDVKCVNLCLIVIVSIYMKLRRNIRSIGRLIDPVHNDDNFSVINNYNYR